MANIDKKGNNRYTNAASSEDRINQIDNNDIVLRILKDEFPDDIFFAQDTLGPGSPVEQALTNDPALKEFPAATRNTKNVLNLSTERDEYTKYELAKTFPTIDEDELDDLIDEEWEYFEDPDDGPIVDLGAIKPTGLFLVASEMSLRDVHDLYINNGPQTIEEDDVDITNRIFCVFFIRNGVAYAIPTYKTLEVMLVERGATYDVLQEATAEQLKEFDLLIDGKQDGSDMTPLEEFRDRTYPVRDSDWSPEIRFRSGYRPVAPFLRDPGDYIKPETLRAIDGRAVIEEDGKTKILTPDLYYEQDPEDRYFDQVFQKQTYKEKLREKFEGKMIIADWPVPYKRERVAFETDIVSDDAVLNLRMMINGHWKFVNDGSVMKSYAYLNDYNISSYVQGSGRYGTNGYIQLLIDAGGCTVVQAADGVSKQNDVLGGNSDIANEVEPLWNAFPHIVDADDDGIKGVDRFEYQEYLDNFTNGGAPFDIEHLQPYEPRGSIKYYPKQQYQDLIAQSIQQDQIDVIKEQIYEIMPEIAALIQNTKTQFDSLPSNLSSYVMDNLGTEGPLYKVMKSSKGNWEFVKKKKKKLKTKASEDLLFKLCSKKLRIKTSLNESQEEKFVNKENHKWMKTVEKTVTDTEGNVHITVPGDIYDLPPWRYMDDDVYWRDCITNEIDDILEGFTIAAADADTEFPRVSRNINEIYSGMGALDADILDASSAEEFQRLFEHMISIQSLCNDLNNRGLYANIISLHADVDTYLADQLKRQYNAIQYLRKKVYEDTNSNKFGIVWPVGPQDILNEYVPGCTFDNFLPAEE